MTPKCVRHRENTGTVTQPRRLRGADSPPVTREDNATNMIRVDGISKCEGTRHQTDRRRPPAEMLHLLSAIIVWLVTGTTISSLNKWIFAVYNFRYPLLLSALHMLTAIVVDYGLIKLRVIHHRGAAEQDLTASAKSVVRTNDLHHHTALYPCHFGPDPGQAASHPQIHSHDAHLPGSILQHNGRGPVRPDWLFFCVCSNPAAGRQIHSAKHFAPGGEDQLRVPALPDVHPQLLHLDGCRSGFRKLGPARVAAALRPSPVGLHPAQLPGLGHVQPGQLLRPHAYLGRHSAHPREPERGGEPAAVSAAVWQRAVRPQLRRGSADAVGDAHLSEL
uniref:Solute carrier family 35 member E4 n=1 Tax=Nothobranchius furzeri TaxID=105023 RepID=A0A8C6P3V3_NOTFU